MLGSNSSTTKPRKTVSICAGSRSEANSQGDWNWTFNIGLTY